MRLVTSAILSLTLLLAVGSQSASADIIFGTGPTAAADNVGSYTQTGPTTATGMLLGGVDDVLLAMTDQALTVPAAGAARIEAANAANPFTTVMYTPIGFSWSIFELNVQKAQGLPNGTFTLTGVDNNGDVFVSGPFTLGNGENRVWAQAINGQDIRKITVTASSALIADIRQVRLTQAAAIPDPSTFALCGVVVGALGISLARRRKIAKA